MRRIVLPLLLIAAVLLAVNTVVVGRETKPARADVGRILDLPDGDLQVRERGPAGAPAIVLVHCYTCSIRWWAKIEPLLTGDRRVISVDLLGHGGSEKPREGYDTVEQADRVAAALRELGVRRALLVGQSLGGAVVTALAERHPPLARGIAIMDSAPSDDYLDLPLTQRLATLPVIGEAGWQLMSDGMIRDGLADAFADGFEVPATFVADVRRMTYSSFTGGHADDYRDERSLDDRVAGTGLPALAVYGLEDRVVTSPDQAADEWRDVPRARVVTLPGVGHTPQVEAPRRTAALIRQLDRRTR